MVQAKLLKVPTLRVASIVIIASFMSSYRFSDSPFAKGAMTRSRVGRPPRRALAAKEAAWLMWHRSLRP